MKNCCEKCLGTGKVRNTDIHYSGCADSSCPCHQEQVDSSYSGNQNELNQKLVKPSDWDKEFDNLYHTEKMAIPQKHYLKIESFIRSLLAQQKHDYEILVNTILETKNK